MTGVHCSAMEALTPTTGDRVFTLLVETRCNSYCVFCGSREIDQALVRSRQRLGLSVPDARFGGSRGRYTLKSATEALSRARADGHTTVSLQGGEPTIWPHLVPLISAARAMGFDRVAMVSNGRRLADADFAATVVDAGLTGLSASLLGADAETHDALSAAPGSFDALLAGLRNVAAVARGRVDITANLVTTARSVATMPEQVRLLAGCGVAACTVHLVRFEGLASDPGVRGPLRFDIREIRAPLDAARRLGRSLGVAVHAPDVPLCLHGEPDPEEIRRVADRGAIDAHRFEAAAFAYDLDHTKAHVRPAACDGCWVSDSCRRVPADYLPDDPSLAFRPLDGPALDAAFARAAAAGAPDDRAHLESLLIAADRLEALAGRPGALAGAVAGVRRHVLEGVRLAAARRDGHGVISGVCTWLGLFPPREALLDDVVAFAAVPAARLAAHVGAGEHLPHAVRFGGSFDVGYEGALTDDGVWELTKVAPVMPPASSPLSRLVRAALLLWVAAPLRAARRMRLDADALHVDDGSGWRIGWSIARPGAIRIIPANPARASSSGAGSPHP